MLAMNFILIWKLVGNSLEQLSRQSHCEMTANATKQGGR